MILKSKNEVLLIPYGFAKFLKMNKLSRNPINLYLYICGHETRNNNIVKVKNEELTSFLGISNSTLNDSLVKLEKVNMIKRILKGNNEREIIILDFTDKLQKY